MNINWFPGHMTKALRQIKESLKLVDMVIETCDARIPLSSRNTEIDKLVQHKPRLIIMNKADLADNIETDKYLKYFKKENQSILAQNALQKSGLQEIFSACNELCREKLARLEAKGRQNNTIKVMVLGIPNTGKSTLINALSKKKATQTSDRPGVTRSLQWVRNGPLELLDMPGVLWPKLGDEVAMLNLAVTGAVKDDVFDIEEIAFLLLKKLLSMYKTNILDRFKIEENDLVNLDFYDIYSLLCKKRGYILSGGRLDTRRFAITFVDEFRAGKLGRITLEHFNG